MIKNAFAAFIDAMSSEKKFGYENWSVCKLVYATMDLKSRKSSIY